MHNCLAFRSGPKKDVQVDTETVGLHADSHWLFIDVVMYLYIVWFRTNAVTSLKFFIYISHTLRGISHHPYPYPTRLLTIHPLYAHVSGIRKTYSTNNQQIHYFLHRKDLYFKYLAISKILYLYTQLYCDNFALKTSFVRCGQIQNFTVVTYQYLSVVPVCPLPYSGNVWWR